MKQLLYGFLLAIQFLTRLPVPVQCPWNRDTSRWAIRSYPLVGMIMAVFLMAIHLLLEPFLPLSMMVLVLLTAWVWLSGGLHLDGWMDVADAVGSNRSLEKKWEIMKDPHVGSFGIIALFFLLAWKCLLVYLLIDGGTLIYSFLFVLAFSRLGAVILMLALPTAKQHGLAWEWKMNISWFDGLCAFLPIAIILFWFNDFLFLLPAYIFFYILFGAWMAYQFKGSNGDLLGAAIEGGELWGLAIIWTYFSFVMG
ncbi:cobalamin synthase [Halalkalibacter wakoensis JCM 9140]|uniref:Adenosylcobinamide-GDP ribazoletransferase n=1 Tax=Halalkalibacter wakoensis JCM 9140 TaxID=1236970 RepID=W4PY91_9BACI|nr:adenosylcobinamide-GDP ribazoletransferase [Halalkalibacter wakoensis]GAE24655.1 cobalamin synthase [Halalkalibacter wakoensis JCM 9140]